MLRGIQVKSGNNEFISVTYIVFNSTAYMKRVIALHTAARHATTICTFAETASFVPPFIWNVEIVNIIASIRILEKNFELM